MRLSHLAVRRESFPPLALLLLLLLSSCAPSIRRTSDQPGGGGDIRQLWVKPVDIASRDLFHGPGGKNEMLVRAPRFTVKAFDTAGNSIGYDVLGREGRQWKVKVGEEVQPEIVASRLLWAIGFHQPSMYFVNSIQLEGGRPEDSGQPARLRAEHGYKTDGEWSWHRNPYVGTRELNGLLVANLILNNWDLKADQNRIYLLDGTTNGPRRRFVVQDLGAALGKTAWPVGTRNRIEHFESQRLIAGVENGRVKFDYHARHRELFENITVADVVWTARLFAQLTDRQWHDAFRAANYPENLSARFTSKIKSKVQEGLALGERAAVRP